MYCDLYLPFPSSAAAAQSANSKKKDKGKGKALPQDPSAPVEERPQSCWDGLAGSERDDVANMIGMAGHLGYNLVACTITPSNPGHIPLSPFRSSRPFPSLDPRSTPGASSSSAPSMVQLSRLHLVLDDSTATGLTASNTAVLNTWDVISVAPTTAASFQQACLSYSQPGTNQISIITLPLHQNPRMPFYLKRSLVKTALRNGAVFELPYSQALSPPSSTSSDSARRTRQNFLTNAREIIRLTQGKGIMFSSGVGGTAVGGWMGMKGPADLINLGCLLGMAANVAAAAVKETPRLVLLRAQARKNYKGVTSQPRMIIPADEEEIVKPKRGSKRKKQAEKVEQDGDSEADWTSKKIKLDV